jgi:hypothetical protein
MVSGESDMPPEKYLNPASNLNPYPTFLLPQLWPALFPTCFDHVLNYFLE